MAKASSKPTMMRFEPKTGWSEADASPTAEVVSITDHPRMEARIEPRVEPIEDENYSAEALVALGESIQDVFDSLQINDPRLQAWTQVHAAIKLIGTKLQEKKSTRGAYRRAGQGNRERAQSCIRAGGLCLPQRTGSARDL